MSKLEDELLGWARNQAFVTGENKIKSDRSLLDACTEYTGEEFSMAKLEFELNNKLVEQNEKMAKLVNAAMEWRDVHSCSPAADYQARLDFANRRLKNAIDEYHKPASPLDKLKDCVYLVEATGYEKRCLRREWSSLSWSDQPLESWTQRIEGGTLQLSFEQFYGQLVCFYEAISQVVNHASVRQWLAKVSIDKPLSNAMNFHNVVQECKRLSQLR